MSNIRHWINLYEEILLENMPRTLYHGTLRRLLPSIMSIGLLPSVGEFTRYAYDELEAAGIELPELVFAADREGLDSCISAILGAMRQVGIEDTLENFFRYGAIVVLKHGEENFDHRTRNEKDYKDYPETVEPGDYYSDYGIKPDFYIVGDRLRVFLRRHNIILDRFGVIDRSAGQTKLMTLAIRKYPNKSRDEIINKIRSLSDREIKYFLKFPKEL